MSDDIVPGLLADITSQFNLEYGQSEEILKALDQLSLKQATYLTANDYAIETGKILSRAFGSHIVSEELPEGKMHYNIANRVLNTTLERNYELVSSFSSQVQADLNQEANISLEVIVPPINQNRIDGFVDGLSSSDEFERVAWLLTDPITNFTQSIVDEFIKVNADFHADAGLTPKVVRQESGNCCDWCKQLVGVYNYPKVPEDVWKRHRRCRCTVDYHPKDGKRKKQNAWTKKWTNDNKDVIEQLKQMNVDIRDNNLKEDIQEYKQIVDVLGARNAPISLSQFQELKYNDGEKYEKLKDRVFVSQKIKSGEWGKKINPDKQLPHMESTHEAGKSYIYDSIDVQSLLDKYSGTGKVEVDWKGRRTNKEIVELNFPIGIAVNEFGSFETNVIKIHHSKKRTHIVPKERR